jgi:hypothetical protein
MSQPIIADGTRPVPPGSTSHRTTGFCRFVRRGPAAGSSESGASYGKDRTPQQSEALHLLLPHVALAGLLRRTASADPARLTDSVLACGSLVEPRTPTVLATREPSRRQPAVSSGGHAGYVHRRRVRRGVDSNDDRCQGPSQRIGSTAGRADGHRSGGPTNGGVDDGRASWRSLDSDRGAWAPMEISGDSAPG